MSTWQIIVGILMFAVATAILYVWGLKKSMSQQDDMSLGLLNACGSRVLKYLKKHDTISVSEIARQIDGVTIKQFWSRKRLTVQNPKKFAPKVIEFLLDQQYIQSVGKDTYKRKP